MAELKTNIFCVCKYFKNTFPLAQLPKCDLGLFESLYISILLLPWWSWARTPSLPLPLRSPGDKPKLNMKLWILKEFQQKYYYFPIYYFVLYLFWSLGLFFSLFWFLSFPPLLHTFNTLLLSLFPSFLVWFPNRCQTVPITRIKDVLIKQKTF